jgi:hypothetical protein
MKKIFRILSAIILTSILFSPMANGQFISNNEAYPNKNFTGGVQINYALAKREISDFSERRSLPMILQDSSITYQIITRDGNEYIGTLIKQNEQEIVLNTTTVGIITIKKDNIKRMKLIEPEKIRDGAYWEDHMQSTRYFWSPNGYGLKKGEAYYQNVWVFFNQFSVGITDNILLGGGLMPFFFFGGAPTPLWITPKVSFPVVENKINVGAGGLFATVLDLGEGGNNFGIVYGTTTFGPRNKNVTIGAGWGYANGSWANRPTFTLSYLSRVGRKGYFISENYLIDTGGDYLFLGMIGGRSMLGSGNIGLDYGLVIPITGYMDTFVAIPWLGITVPIGEGY